MDFILNLNKYLSKSFVNELLDSMEEKKTSSEGNIDISWIDCHYFFDCLCDGDS